MSVKNYKIPLIEGLITKAQLIEICRNLGGDEKTLDYKINAEAGIAYGEFIMTASLEEIQWFTKCKKYFATSEPNRGTQDKSVEIEFKCIVMKQPNDKLLLSEIFEVPDFEPIVFSVGLVDVVSYLPVLLFSEKVEDDYLPYEVSIHEENSDITVCNFYNRDRHVSEKNIAVEKDDLENLLKNTN